MRVSAAYTALSRAEWALARVAGGEGALAGKYRHPAVAPYLRALQRQFPQIEALLSGLSGYSTLLAVEGVAGGEGAVAGSRSGTTARAAADEPCVHCSGLTWPVVSFWIVSSPTDLAAAIASWMSWSVRSWISTLPWRVLGAWWRCLAHMPA